MSTKSIADNEESCPRVDWTDSILGVVAGSGAGLCCAGPLLFGALGLSGVAGALASLPFVYHVVLQWFALSILVGAWTWFLYKFFQLPKNQRWNKGSIVTTVILTGISLYVLRSWATHVLI